MPLSPFSWRGQWRLPRLARSWQLDVFHSPYYLAPYFMPCPLVVTIHDVIPARDPRYLPSMRSRLIFRLAVTLAVRRAQQVIVDSQASQKDLVAFFGAKGERVKVVPLAADEFIVAQAERPVPSTSSGTESIRGLSPYFLCVSINVAGGGPGYEAFRLRSEDNILGSDCLRRGSVRRPGVSCGIIRRGGLG